MQGNERRSARGRATPKLAALTLAWRAFLVISAWAVAPAAWALASDRDQAIDIEADAAEVDDNQGITIYTGDVVITQGTLTIHGDKVTIFFNADGDLAKMITDGRPARFTQLPDGVEDLDENYQRANAAKMEYFKDEDLIVLIGNAVYGQGRERIEADRIEYDSKRGRMKARTEPATRVRTKTGEPPPKRKRVRIRLLPKSKEDGAAKQ